MTVYELDIPDADSVIGQLYGPEFSEELAEDMLLVNVAGHGIDVRWQPPYSTSGRYVVRVYRGAWQRKISEREFSDPVSVKRFVEDATKALAHPRIPVSSVRLSPLCEGLPLHAMELTGTRIQVFADLGETTDDIKGFVMAFRESMGAESPARHLRPSTLKAGETRMGDSRFRVPRAKYIKMVPRPVQTEAVFTI